MKEEERRKEGGGGGRRTAGGTPAPPAGENCPQTSIVHNCPQIQIQMACIAASALAEGCRLVTHNLAHFGRCPSLPVEDWTA